MTTPLPPQLRTSAVPARWSRPPALGPSLIGLPAGLLIGLLIGLLAAVAGGACAGPGVTFDQQEIERHRMLAGTAPGFMLGVATSAHQIEGGNHNDWTDWEKGRYPDGTPHVAASGSAARAADSWNLWPKDIAAVEELGANVYRLGIEWSRLEPTEGAWSAAAAGRYRDMLRALREARPRPIRPMLNLYHFTLPGWVAARGGWEWTGAPEAFAAFAARAADAFGDLVDDWCTINEPNVYVSKGYLAGQWPPGLRDPARGARVLARLLEAHGLAAAALRARDRVDADGDGAATRIGLAHNVRIFDAASWQASWNPLDGWVAGIADRFYNQAIPDAVATGRIRIALPASVTIDEPAPALRGSLDWLGINYYTRDVIRARVLRALTGAGPPYEAVVDPERARSDMGWEIYPEGLLRSLVRFASYGWPLVVTESGIADRAGTTRPGFIRSHIYAIDRARAAGVNVIGYFHWSLIDNFEWSHGYEGRFGLYTIDFDGDPALERRATPAVATFQELSRTLGLLAR